MFTLSLPTRCFLLGAGMLLIFMFVLEAFIFPLHVSYDESGMLHCILYWKVVSSISHISC